MKHTLLIELPKIYKKQQIFEFNRGCQTVEEFLGQFSSIKKVEESFLYRSEKKKNSVIDFLHQHSFLIDILFESIEKIKSLFGNEVRLFLELEKDPEESFDELFIIIKTNESIKNALQKLEALDKEWFLKILPRTENLLNITIESKNEI